MYVPARVCVCVLLGLLPWRKASLHPRVIFHKRRWMAFVQELNCYAVFLWLFASIKIPLIEMRNGGGVIVDRTIAFRKKRSKKKDREDLLNFLEFIDRSTKRIDLIEMDLFVAQRFIFHCCWRDILEERGKIPSLGGNNLFSLLVFSRKYFH